MGNQLINDSLNLLVQGIGVVFVFLLALVLATRLMSWLVNRLVPYRPESAPPPADSGEIAASVDPLTVKIIQAALDQHRRRH